MFGREERNSRSLPGLCMDDIHLQDMINIGLAQSGIMSWQYSLVCIIASKSVHCLSKFATIPMSVIHPNRWGYARTRFLDCAILAHLDRLLPCMLYFTYGLPLLCISYPSRPMRSPPTSYSFSGFGRLLDESSESSSHSRLTILIRCLRAFRTCNLGVSSGVSW